MAFSPALLARALRCQSKNYLTTVPSPHTWPCLSVIGDGWPPGVGVLFLFFPLLFLCFCFLILTHSLTHSHPPSSHRTSASALVAQQHASKQPRPCPSSAHRHTSTRTHSPTHPHTPTPHFTSFSWTKVPLLLHTANRTPPLFELLLVVFLAHPARLLRRLLFEHLAARIGSIVINPGRHRSSTLPSSSFFLLLLVTVPRAGASSSSAAVLLRPRLDLVLATLILRSR